MTVTASQNAGAAALSGPLHRINPIKQGGEGAAPYRVEPEMLPLATAAQMKELDRRAIEERGIPSLELM